MQAGESLWSIARDTYASGGLWPEIAGANPDKVHNGGDLIYAGDTLEIPEIDIGGGACDADQMSTTAGLSEGSASEDAETVQSGTSQTGSSSTSSLATSNSGGTGGVLAPMYRVDLGALDSFTFDMGLWVATVTLTGEFVARPDEAFINAHGGPDQIGLALRQSLHGFFSQASLTFLDGVATMSLGVGAPFSSTSVAPLPPDGMHYELRGAAFSHTVDGVTFEGSLGYDIDLRSRELATVPVLVEEPAPVTAPEEDRWYSDITVKDVAIGVGVGVAVVAVGVLAWWAIGAIGAAGAGASLIPAFAS